MEKVIKKDDDKKSYTVEELVAIIASFTRAIQTLSTGFYQQNEALKSMVTAIDALEKTIIAEHTIHSTLMMDVRDKLAQVEEHYKCT